MVGGSLVEVGAGEESGQLEIPCISPRQVDEDGAGRCIDPRPKER